MSDIAIKVDHVSKLYKLYDKPSDRFKEALGFTKEKKYKEELIEAGINENNIKAYGFAFEGKNVLILD